MIKKEDHSATSSPSSEPAYWDGTATHTRKNRVIYGQNGVNQKAVIDKLLWNLVKEGRTKTFASWKVHTIRHNISETIGELKMAITMMRVRLAIERQIRN